MCITIFVAFFCNLIEVSRIFISQAASQRMRRRRRCSHSSAADGGLGRLLLVQSAAGNRQPHANMSNGLAANK